MHCRPIERPRTEKQQWSDTGNILNQAHRGQGKHCRPRSSQKRRGVNHRYRRGNQRYSKQYFGISTTSHSQLWENRKRPKLPQNAIEMIGAKRQETEARHMGIASTAGKWWSAAAQPELG